MTCRTESSQVWVHEYNTENRISTVYKMDGTDCASQGSATDTWVLTNSVLPKYLRRTLSSK
jgi:hypothetical protein